MRSTLVKSLLIDFLLTPVGLPHGDDARCLAARSMSDYDHSSRQQAQCYKPLLSIVEAAVLEGDARPGKHQFRVLEIQAMLGEVAAILRSVPFVYHLHCSAFCSYMQICGAPLASLPGKSAFTR